MTSKTTNKVSPEVRARAVRMVAEHEAEHPSRWAAVCSIAAKIGCSAHTLNEWVKKAEVDSGKRAGVPSDMAEKMKALERENPELRQANEILRKASGSDDFLHRRKPRGARFSPRTFSAGSVTASLAPTRRRNLMSLRS
jgi:transposase